MAKETRVPTGIVELDALIEGGLRAGKTYLVVGEPGTGKTVFGLQFLVNGLMEKEKGLYVAIDEKPADVLDQAASWVGTWRRYRVQEFVISTPGLLQRQQRERKPTCSVVAGYITHGATRLATIWWGRCCSTGKRHRGADQRACFDGLQANGNTTNLPPLPSNVRPRPGRISRRWHHCPGNGVGRVARAHPGH
jgi:hypothetical protein